MMRPSIGVSCNPSLAEEARKVKYRPYLEAVAYAGGAPYLLTSAEEFARLRPQLDGLLLTGGEDISPALYGEEDHPALGPVVHERDTLELTLIRWALQEDVPTLAICRGMQLLNVELGGTLYQDLADQYPRSLEHKIPGEPRCHTVRALAGSRMEGIVGASEFWVNSRHHQALWKLGKGMQISGFAEDGVAELFELSGYRLVIGAQCHPEDIYMDVPACARLFSAFIEECVNMMKSENATDNML